MIAIIFFIIIIEMKRNEIIKAVFIGIIMFVKKEVWYILLTHILYKITHMMKVTPMSNALK